MTKYRDPRPDEVSEDIDRELARLLPPERHAYWRQVSDDDYPTPRMVTTSTVLFQADVQAYQSELLRSALEDMATSARLLREALERVV